jgi:hypothetical protein
MEEPTVLVMNHIYNRRMSYMSGVMTCRSSVDGVPLGERLSTLSTIDLEKVDKHNFDTLDLNTKDFLKMVKTSCQSVGHSEEAAKYARQKCFAMLDFFGFNSLFLNTTPDDECSFRVRLYTKPQNWVSVQNPSKYLDPKYFDNPFTRTKTQYSWNSNILSICFLLKSFSNWKLY